MFISNYVYHQNLTNSERFRHYFCHTLSKWETTSDWEDMFFVISFFIQAKKTYVLIA